MLTYTRTYNTAYFLWRCRKLNRHTSSVTMTCYLSCKVYFSGYNVLTVSRRCDGVIVLTTTEVLLCMGNLCIDKPSTKNIHHSSILTTYNAYASTHGCAMASAFALMGSHAYINMYGIESHPPSGRDDGKYPAVMTRRDTITWSSGYTNCYDSRHHQYHVSECGKIVYVTPHDDIIHFRRLRMRSRYHIVMSTYMLCTQCDVQDIRALILRLVLTFYRVDSTLPTITPNC